MDRLLQFAICFLACVFATASIADAQDAKPPTSRLGFNSIPDLPDPVGVAGPIVGVHNGVMIVAGGANFGLPDDPKLWDVPKAYHDRAWILERKGNGDDEKFSWRSDTAGFRLSQNVAYPAVVNIEHGVLCMGGENADGPVNRAFLVSWNAGDKSLVENDATVPDLPLPCTACGAAVIGDYVYLVAGQTVDEDRTKAGSRTVWRLKLDVIDPDKERDLNKETQLWEPVVSWPEEGPRRMFPLVTAQHDGFKNRLYVIGGRRFLEDEDPADLYNLKFSSDCWSFDPTAYDSKKLDLKTGNYDGPSPWKRIADAPVPMTAGTAVPFGPAHIIVPAYATGKGLRGFLDSGKEMKDYAHPGFPKEAYAYHTITDTWTGMGDIPAGQVTTPAVRWGDDIMLISGEVRPRVRSPKCWRISVNERKAQFGAVNMTVVVLYLLAMLGIGVFFDGPLANVQLIVCLTNQTGQY